MFSLFSFSLISRITGENMHFGTPTNPSFPFHIPGGSSSGSAVAVAAHLVDFAIGMCNLVDSCNFLNGNNLVLALLYLYMCVRIYTCAWLCLNKP